jgi:hydrogenase expression/formation protein HypC
MCLGIPGRIIEIKGRDAVVDVGGVRKVASLMLLDGAVVNEYVIVHAGFAIQRLDEREAEETLTLIDALVHGI